MHLKSENVNSGLYVAKKNLIHQCMKNQIKKIRKLQRAKKLKKKFQAFLK